MSNVIPNSSVGAASRSEQGARKILDAVKAVSVVARDRISGDASPGAPIILLLHGLPGVGKTQVLTDLRTLWNDKGLSGQIRRVTSHRSREMSEEQLRRRLSDLQRQSQPQEVESGSKHGVMTPGLLESVLDAQIDWISDVLWKLSFVGQDASGDDIVVLDWDPWVSYLTFKAAMEHSAESFELPIKKARWIERFDPNASAFVLSASRPLDIASNVPGETGWGDRFRLDTKRNVWVRQDGTMPAQEEKWCSTLTRDEMGLSREIRCEPLFLYLILPILRSGVVHAYFEPSHLIGPGTERRCFCADERNATLRRHLDDGAPELISDAYDRCRTQAIEQMIKLTKTWEDEQTLNAETVALEYNCGIEK